MSVPETLGRFERATPRRYHLAVVSVGRKQSPRVLLLGFTPNDAEKLSALFPTTREISSVDEVDQEEYDALITMSGVEDNVAPHLFVFAIGGRLQLPHGERGIRFRRFGSWLAFAREVLSAEFLVPDDLPQPLRALVDDLMAALGQPPHAAIVETDGVWAGTTSPPAIVAFLRSRAGLVLAGRYRRPGDKAECWAIPVQGADIRWIQAAIAHWRTLDPIRFPGDPDWKHHAEWRTTAEAESIRQIELLESEREQFLADIDKRHRELSERLGAHRGAADQRERALLSDQGDSLTAAIADCLIDLGFEVANMDQALAGTPKREDLRVTIPGRRWTAIVEVKGYKDGAKTNDLGKFIRYSELFVKEEGRPPDAKWYIVNQFKDNDPAARQEPLRGAAADIEVFGEVGGLIIDTTRLLRLWLRVQFGLPRKEARQALIEAHGLFAVPAQPLEADTTSGA